MALAEAADDEAEVDIPAKLKRHEDRREASRAAKAEMEARAATRHEEEVKAWREKRRGRKGGGKPPSPLQPGSRAKDQVILTGPESRIMKTDDGFEQACNAQTVADNASPGTTTTMPGPLSILPSTSCVKGRFKNALQDIRTMARHGKVHGIRDIRVDPFADLALARERDVSADLRQAFLFFAREGKLRSGAVLFDDRGEQVLVVMTGPTGEGRMPGAGKQLKGGMELTPV
nr:hypothetical protein [Alphaproteobacteria bacterium]